MNNFQQTFEHFLATQNVEVSLTTFVINLLIAAALSLVLGQVYTKYGNAISNRMMFARNFLPITMTTMLIITVVKSSLALSLGLVGALSIVRFRTAIKEPEELSYLFLSISIGLGLGAGQREITLLGFIIIICFILLKGLIHKSIDNQNLYLTITSNAPQKIEVSSIVDILKQHCSEIELKRFDETKDTIEAAFLAEFIDLKHLEQGKTELQLLNDTLKISLLDNKRIGV